MSASLPQVRLLVSVLAEKIAASEAELDAQAISNALYGLQVEYHFTNKETILYTTNEVAASHSPSCACSVRLCFQLIYYHLH